METRKTHDRPGPDAGTTLPPTQRGLPVAVACVDTCQTSSLARDGDSHEHAAAYDADPVVGESRGPADGQTEDEHSTDDGGGATDGDRCQATD